MAVRILVVGSGGREHALAWKLSQDAARPQVFVAPGNPGTAEVAENVRISPTDLAGLVAFGERSAIDLTIVGPEAPLANGIVDIFQQRGLRIFGPTRAAAGLESSKGFAKDLMRRSGIPTAAFAIFDQPAPAVDHVRRLGRPAVVKADGLAAGKGVVVCQSVSEAERAIEEVMVRGVVGEAGRRVVIEERLEGTEASLLVLAGPGGVVPLIPARDYKRLSDGDRGPNTGGMGAIAPVDLVPIIDSIVEPAIGAMRRDGCPFTGVLYVGLMLTADGPKVLEFNCRFGDPEAQVILPLLETDLAPTLIDVIEGHTPAPKWKSGFAACVALASEGYPGSPQVGKPIHGLARMPEDTLVFHAGTRRDDDALVSGGGRVLNVVGRGATLHAAVERAYTGASRISFEGMQFRTDIGRARESAVATGARA